MTLLYYDPRFTDHDTGHHPERAERVRQIVARLESTELTEQCIQPMWLPASRERLELVHEAPHVDRVISMAERGGGFLDPDTVLCKASADVARIAAGAACDAVDRVITGEAKTALCIVRPPGHHAVPERAMGFCLFNNVAVAARVATEEHGLDRVLIVDWDVHHGNGTQDTFYADGRVGFLSIHRWPFYPGTGAADETGVGDGEGANLNLPVTTSTRRERYIDTFRSGLEKLAEHIRPQLVLISAGFDAHRSDPIGSFILETEDYQLLTQMVLDVAAVHSEGRVVSILEGGYNPPVLAECVELHLRHLHRRGPS